MNQSSGGRTSTCAARRCTSFAALGPPEESAFTAASCGRSRSTTLHVRIRTSEMDTSELNRDDSSRGEVVSERSEGSVREALIGERACEESEGERRAAKNPAWLRMGSVHVRYLLRQQPLRLLRLGARTVQLQRLRCRSAHKGSTSLREPSYLFPTRGLARDEEAWE